MTRIRARGNGAVGGPAAGVRSKQAWQRRGRENECCEADFYLKYALIFSVISKVHIFFARHKNIYFFIGAKSTDFPTKI